MYICIYIYIYVYFFFASYIDNEITAYLNPRNRTPLNNIIDIHAHSISLLQAEKPTHIFESLINQNNISIAEPVEIQIDESVNNVITMYEFVGDINDNKVPGLESITLYK